MNAPHLKLVTSQRLPQMLDELDALTQHAVTHHARRDAVARTMAAASYFGLPVVHYQPKVDLTTGRIYGAEALVRWKSVVHGLLSPDVFLPVLRENDQMRALDLIVLSEAIAQAEAWKSLGLNLVISVNASPQHFHDPQFADDVLTILGAYPQFDPGGLAIEILESLEIKNIGVARGIIEQLRDVGVRFYMDDFGTGHSSPSCLKQLPLDAIKIDQMFVRGLGSTDGSLQDRAIVRAAIDMATAFGVAVIAEGIETMEAAAELLKLGCRIGQGYGIGRPMSPTDFETWYINRVTVTGSDEKSCCEGPV